MAAVNHRYTTMAKLAPAVDISKAFNFAVLSSFEGSVTRMPPRCPWPIATIEQRHVFGLDEATTLQWYNKGSGDISGKSDSNQALEALEPFGDAAFEMDEIEFPNVPHMQLDIRDEDLGIGSDMHILPGDAESASQSLSPGVPTNDFANFCAAGCEGPLADASSDEPSWPLSSLEDTIGAYDETYEPVRQHPVDGHTRVVNATGVESPEYKRRESRADEHTASRCDASSQHDTPCPTEPSPRPQIIDADNLFDFIVSDYERRMASNDAASFLDDDASASTQLYHNAASPTIPDVKFTADALLLLEELWDETNEYRRFVTEEGCLPFQPWLKAAVEEGDDGIARLDGLMTAPGRPAAVVPPQQSKETKKEKKKGRKSRGKNGSKRRRHNEE
ncbi:hypothetical protein EIP91_001074 [Steccherinum ochraceum]|uniref:Uncharacterized protein n=1 Tax=Steccherinum ochraceum TaxID=92696 RepID=A0A4R0RH25_9APHY|nr:hypothetical protein EIP91_001074 [Steccherinum ochraceum]